ncbi:MAG: nuclear transport factor 2 family protein [Chitinophagaceae bacterium]
MKTLSLLSILFLGVMPFTGFSQAAETPAQKIRRLEETERTLVVNGETEKLFKLWTDDYVVNNPGNVVMTATQIKNSIRGGGMRGVAYTKNIEKITFTKDIAIVMGSEIVEPKDKFDNGGKNTIRRYTNIWIKSDTTWQLAARQATNLISN